MKTYIMTIAAAGVLVVGLLLSPSPATAASPTIVEKSTKTVNFTKTGQYYSSAVKRCLKVKVTGTMKVQYVRSTDYLGNDYQSLTNPTIHAPKMVLSTTSSCSTSAGANLSSAKLTQTFSYYACGGSVSYSAGYPLSVGISWTPECGNRQAINRSMELSGPASVFTQANSNSVGTVKKVVSGRTSTSVKTCVAVGTLVTARVGSTGDNVKIDAGDICVTV